MMTQPRAGLRSAQRRRLCLLCLGLTAWSVTPALAHGKLGPVKPPRLLPAGLAVQYQGKRIPLRALLLGRTSAVQLMFAGCSSVCPVQGAMFAAVQAELGPDALPALQLLSLSIDARGDDAPALASWLQRFAAQSRWRAAALEEPDLAALQTLFDASADNPAGHSTAVYFFDAHATPRPDCCNVAALPAPARSLAACLFLIKSQQSCPARARVMQSSYTRFRLSRSPGSIGMTTTTPSMRCLRAYSSTSDNVMTSRRSFLRNSARAGIAAGTYAAFPASIQRALAIPANNATGTIRDVEHVVILMQENRAFDHYFGTLAGVRGFGDRFPIPLPEGRNVWQQKMANGNVMMPFHLDGSKGNAQRANGTPHDWNDSQQAWDNGRMDQWPRYKNPISMGYFKQTEIPFHFALANAFTVCDAYHCAMHTGTDANRSFFLTGTNGAVPTGTAFVSNEWDAIDGVANGVNTGYTWTTYAERLEAAGVRWISYQNMPDEWGDNMLGAFRQFKRANIASGYPVSSGGAPGQPYTNTGQALPYHAYDAASDNVNNPLYKGIANTLPGTQPEQYLDAFKRDIREGKLPQVSWMNAPSIYCEHPGPSSPVQGSWFLQEVLDALTANPEVWSKTVLIVNFDENDGYFDHVPSPSAPSPDGKGGYAGKTTLAPADLAAEYYTHGRPAGSTRQPAADVRARACRCTSSRPGAGAAGSTRRCSTTPRCCGSWKRVSVSGSRTSARSAVPCAAI
jgi:phospholipase C/cytochrome oxidase Cu insertion factor (SCO1/SenC/PrrC family)